MTAQGQRIDPGWFNNLVSRVLNWNRDSLHLKGCGEQVQEVGDALRSQEFDVKWKFIDQSKGQTWPFPPFPFPHQWLLGVSEDPTDPYIVIDPYKNKFYTLFPNGQVGSGNGGGGSNAF